MFNKKAHKSHYNIFLPIVFCNQMGSVTDSREELKGNKTANRYLY